MPLSESDYLAATRVVLEDVWYTNALPEWYTPETIDFNGRANRLVQRAGRYLRNAAPPVPLAVQIPRIAG